MNTKDGGSGDKIFQTAVTLRLTNGNDFNRCAFRGNTGVSENLYLPSLGWSGDFALLFFENQIRFFSR